MTTPHAPKSTSLVAVVLAWTLVAIPLGWGLYQSVVKSKPLFTGSTVAR
jgi:hypothetical protein